VLFAALLAFLGPFACSSRLVDNMILYSLLSPLVDQLTVVRSRCGLRLFTALKTRSSTQISLERTDHLGRHTAWPISSPPQASRSDQYGRASLTSKRTGVLWRGLWGWSQLLAPYRQHFSLETTSSDGRTRSRTRSKKERQRRRLTRIRRLHWRILVHA